MASPNQGTFKSAITDLKEIVSRTQGANPESISALNQLEVLIADLEGKSRAGAVIAGQAVVVSSIATTVATV